MSGEDTKFKSFYDSDEVLCTLAEYFLKHDEKEIVNAPLSKVYKDVVSQFPDRRMPKYGQMRKFVLDELKSEGQISENEKLTSGVAYRLTNIYIYEEDFADLIRENNVKVIQKKIIPCVIPLLDLTVLDMLTDGIHEEKGSTLRERRRTLITKICRSIKNKHKDIILAAISEANPLITDKNPLAKKNTISDEDNPVFSCSAICLYVIDNEKGREFIRSITSKNAIMQYI